MIETGWFTSGARIVFIAILLFTTAVPSRVNASQYTPHAPISIIGDSGFTLPNGVTGGGGTSSDPYMISGWDIEVPTSGGSTIEIQNTTANFVITNVYLHAIQGSNLLLINVANGVI